MSLRANVPVPPGFNTRSAQRARAILRRQLEAADVNEDEEPVTENETSDSEDLPDLRHAQESHQGLRRGPEVSRELRLQRQLRSEQDLRAELLESVGAAYGAHSLGVRELHVRGESHPRGELHARGESHARGELHARGEQHARGESQEVDPGVDHEGFFGGPDLGNSEVRAAVGFLTSVFRIPAFSPDSPDAWVGNVKDALFAAGMSAIFDAADCRNKTEVLVRVRNAVDLIPSWKKAFAWTAIRKSISAIPSISARTQKCKQGDVETLVRSVLDHVQKRSQGVETRLREEVAAANLADYPSLRAYITDLEAKFNKLASHGVIMTDGEQRHLLLRGLTADYSSIKASILTYRGRFGQRADFNEAVSMLEDFEDNSLTSTPRTLRNNREVTFSAAVSRRGGGGCVLSFFKEGHLPTGQELQVQAC